MWGYRESSKPDGVWLSEMAFLLKGSSCYVLAWKLAFNEVEWSFSTAFHPFFPVTIKLQKAVAQIKDKGWKGDWVMCFAVLWLVEHWARILKNGQFRPPLMDGVQSTGPPATEHIHWPLISWSWVGFFLCFGGVVGFYHSLHIDSCVAAWPVHG